MGDPLAVIQNFAGVARAEAGSGFIMVRGSAPYDTAYFFDGTLVPIVYHFGGIRSVMPTGMMDSLQFYPGNFSPFYSWVTGGIIDIDIKKLQPKKIGGYVDVNLLDGGFYLEVPIGKKAAVALAARRSYVDYIVNAVLPDDAPINALTLPRYYDFQLLATYRPAPAHDLRLFLFGSDDRFEIILKNPGMTGTTEISGNQIQFSTTFYRALATYKYVPSERFENTIRLSQGRDIQNTQIFNWTLELHHRLHALPRYRQVPAVQVPDHGRGPRHHLRARRPACSTFPPRRRRGSRSTPSIPPRSCTRRSPAPTTTFRASSPSWS